MKGTIFIALVFAIFQLSCKTNSQSEILLIPIEQVKKENISLDIYDFESFKPLLSMQNDTLYVINFWATWCTPCVKELPHFEKITQKYKNKKVKVILVSLDFKNQLNEVLFPFLQKKQLQSKVILLSDSNADYWINQVSKDWTGAIPATIIRRNKEFSFYEKSFEFNELDSLVSKFK
jgi:thiol-disulfide isomerase/thioredoxin